MQRINRLSVALLLLATTTAFCQVRRDADKVVEVSDEIYPILLAKKVEITEAYEEDGFLVPRFSKDWVEIESAAAQRLFPGLRFAVIEWSLVRHPQAQREVSTPAQLELTLVVDPKAGAVVAQLPTHGSYEQFGKFLSERKVSLRDEADAKLIWDAYCDLHHGQHWKDRNHERRSKTEWRLGCRSYDETISTDGEYKTVRTRTSYMYISTVGEAAHVLSCLSGGYTSEERRVPVEPK